MSDVNANIRVNVSTQEAQAQLAALQQQINLLNKSMTSQMGGRMDMGAKQFKGMHGEIMMVNDAASKLNATLSKGGNLKLGQAFGNVKDALSKNGAAMQLATRNAAEMGRQYELLGKQANGAMSVFRSANQMQGFNQAMALSSQRVAIFARALDQAGTSVLNWGKNMQWAGRQLMVGFTVPLTIFGAIAIKTFQDVERQIIDLQKVYGDFSTSAEETERVTESVRELAGELTKLGFTAKDTLALASDAAAIGFKNEELLDFTKQATRMAALGMMTQTEALNTMVSLNSAFSISVSELSKELDFMNAVENETILSMQDMSEAIPITATAVRGLGGDVRDLAVFLTAMREGGINANEAANSLKTSLARLITPTRQASETAAQLGINLTNIVSENEGDLMEMILSLSKAMEGLSDLQQQQLLSDLFGKRQFARMGALFNNIANESSQAATAMDLMNASAEDLARNTEKELKVLEESPVMKLTAAMESLKLAIAPIGELFAKFLTPVIEFGAKVLERFNELPDALKLGAAAFAALIGIVVPGLTMFIGLMGNLVGTLMNGVARTIEFAKGTKYLATEEIGAAAAAEQLETAQMGVNSTLQQQASIVAQLTAQYDRLVASMARVPAGGQVRGMPMRFATGGRVPGTGNTDKVPALLTPGEFVVNKKQSQKNAGFLHALNNGSVKGFVHGGPVGKVDVGGGKVITLNVQWPAEEAARLQQMVSGRLDALEGDIQNQDQLIRTVQSLVDRIEGGQGRAGATSREQRQGFYDEFGTKGQFVGASARRLKSERLMRARGFDSSTKAMADSATAVEMSLIENRSDRNLLASKLRMRKKDDYSSSEGFLEAQRTIDQLENSNRDLTEILRDIAENDKLQASDRRRLLGVATQSASNKSHAMDSIRIPSRGIVGTVGGQNPQHLMNAVGRGNSSVEFLGNYTLDLPGAVNKGMSGGKTMKGAEIQASIMNAQQQGERALETMRQQWLAYAKDAKISQDEIINGLQRIDQAEDQFYNRIQNMTESELSSDWTEGVVDGSTGPVLNSVIEESVEQPLRQGGLEISGAMNDFVDTIKRIALEIRSKITQQGKDTLDALIAYQKGEATDAQREILITAGHVDVDTGQLTSTAPRDVSYNKRSQSYSFTDPTSGQSSKWHTGGGIGDLTGVEEWLAVREALGEEIRRDDEEAMAMYQKEYARVKKTNYKTVTSASAFQGGLRELKDPHMKALGKNFSADQIKKAEAQVKSLKAAVVDGSISISQFGDEFRQLDAAGQAVATTMYENTTAFQYMQQQAQQATLAGTQLAQAFDRIANEQQAAQVRNLTKQFEMGKMSYEQYVAGLRSAAQASRGQLLSEGMQSGKAIDDGLARYLQIKSPSRLGQLRARQWIDGIVGMVRGSKGRVRAAGMETGQALDQGLVAGQKGGMNKNRLMQTGGMAAGQAISMLSMGAYMLPGQEIAGMSKEVVAQFGFLAGQVNSFAAMFGPKGMIVAAIITAVVAAISVPFALWRSSVDKAAKEAARLGSEMGGAADAAKRMSDVLGKSTLLDRQGTLQLSEEQKGLYDEFTSVFESEEGQKLVKEIQEATSTERFEKMSYYIKTAITNGMMEGADAEVFAKAFADAVGDAKLGESVSKEIEKFNKEFTNSTNAAMEIAQSRSVAIQRSAATRRANNAMANGQDINYRDASKIVGSSMQAINDWATVAAAAKEDYQAGIISYNEYEAALNASTQAQNEYTNSLRYALSNSSDGGAVEQALKDRLVSQGYDEKIVEDFKKNVEDTAKTTAEQARQEKIKLKYEEEYNKALKAELDVRKSMNQDALGILESPETMAARAAENAVRDLRNETVDVSDEVDEALGIWAAAIGSGLDPDTAETIAQEVADKSSDVGKIYYKVLDETENTFQAMNAAIAARNIGMDETNPLSQSKALREQFFTEMGTAFDPTMFSNIFENMSSTQYKKTLEARKGLNIEDAKQFDINMDSIADAVGPEMVATLSPYVAESIEEGMKDGGTTGMNELMKVLDNDADAFKSYMEFALADGSLGYGEIKSYFDILSKFKNEIPPEVRTLLDIDIANPEILAMLQDPNAIANLKLMGEALMSLPEEEREIGANLMIKQNGEVKKPAQFVKDMRKVRKSLDEMSEKDFEGKKEMMYDVQTSLNGANATPEKVAAAFDELTKLFGSKAVEAMDTITLVTYIDSFIDATALEEDAKKLDEAADIAFSEGNVNEGSALASQASAKRREAAVLKSEAAAGPAGNVFNSSPTSGGGGGGGDSETNWLEDTIKTKEDNQNYIKRLNNVKEQNLKLAKRGVKLSEEIMEAIAKDEDAYDDYMNGKYSNKKIRNAYYKNLAFEEKEQNKAMKRQKRQEDLVKNAGIGNYFVEQQILNDPELLSLFEEKPKQALEIAKERAAVETTLLDTMERQYQVETERLNLIRQGLELEIQRGEYLAENAFFDKSGSGKDRAQINQENAELQAEIAVLQATQLDPIQDKINAQKDYIKLLQREFQVNEDNIKLLQREVEGKQRIAEDMKRALELRQREAQMLDHDLKLMDYAAEDIEKSYDKRIAALDEIASLNQQIAQAQQDQLGLADALSRGDVSAAAAAAQQMQQNQMSAAADQFRSQLETSRDSQLASLTGAESGLTRDQITERQRELEEDSYQTNLQIRAVEDEIYNLNMKIRDENDIIRSYKDKIEGHNRNIRDYEWQIYQIEKDTIQPLQAKVDANDLLLKQADLAVTKANKEDKIALARFNRETAMWDAQQQFAIARQSWEEEHGKRIIENTRLLRIATKQANEYYKGLNRGDGALLDMPTLRTVSTTQLKTQDLKKFSDALDGAFADYNSTTASFNVPGSAVGSGAVSGIMGNVTNNYMNNNVSVNAMGASADQVADIVIQKLETRGNRSIGGL